MAWHLQLLLPDVYLNAASKLVDSDFVRAANKESGIL